MLTDLKRNETGVELPEQLELSGAFVGKSKDSLDAVDLSVPPGYGCAVVWMFFCATMSIALEGHHPVL